MLKRIFIGIILSSASIIVCYAQKDLEPGYVITHDHDTLHGKIDLQSNYHNSRKCIFQKHGETALQVFRPTDIHAYRIKNEKFYVAHEIDFGDMQERVFLEYLVNGIVDLYYLKKLDEEYYFIEKDGQLHELSNDNEFVSKNGREYQQKSNQYIGMLNYLFHDSPETKAKIQHTDFRYGSLINITKEYHEQVCDDYACVDYTKNAESTIHYMAYAGFGYHELKIQHTEDQAFSYAPFLGFGIKYNPAKLNKLWKGWIGIDFSHNRFEGFFVVPSKYGSDNKYFVDLQYTTVRIPLKITYSFPMEKIQPFVSVGYANNFVFKSKYEVVQHDKYFSGSTNSAPTDMRIYKYGFSGGIGVKYHLKDKSYIFLQAEVENRLPAQFIRNAYDLHKIRALLVTGGYAF